MRRPEHALQVAVAHMLTVVLDPERTWWSSIDHGVGKLGKAEAGIRKKRGVKAGLPDIIVMRLSMVHDWHPLVGIELKADKGKLSSSQVDVAKAWSEMGAAIYVARSLEEVQEILEHERIPMRRRMVFFPKQGHPYDGGDDEPAERPTSARHFRPQRRRKPKNHLPLVLADAAQKE